MPIQIQKNNIKLMCQNKKISKMYCQKQVIYSSGTQVIYSLDTDSSCTYEIGEGESYANQPFTPLNSDYPVFIGWKDTTEAAEPVLTAEETLVISDEPITTYALFGKPISIEYYENETGDGQVVYDTKYLYYNNGNIENPTFVVQNSSFAKDGYALSRWMDSSGNTYKPGDEIQISEGLKLIANWLPNVSGNLAGDSKYVTLNNGVGEKNDVIYWGVAGAGDYYSIGTTATVNRTQYGNTNPNSVRTSISIRLNGYKRAVVTLYDDASNETPWYTNDRYAQITINGSMVYNGLNQNDNHKDRQYTLTSDGTISIYCRAHIKSNNDGNYTYVVSSVKLKSVIFYM